MMSVSSCSWLGLSQNSSKKAQDSRGLDSAMPSVEGVNAYVPGGMDKAGQAGAKALAVSTEEELLKLKFSDDDVYFTNPDQPDALIPEIEEAFSQKGKTYAWNHSYETGLQEGRRTGKPILVWFHDSKRSPASNNLGKELLDTKEFSDWAGEKVVRVRFDSGVDSKRGQDVNYARQNYVNALLARFGLRGKPSYAVLSPDGRLIEANSGYVSGTADAVMRTLEHAVKMGNKRFDELKDTLRPKGFREWTGANGRQIFAQMSRQSPASNEVWLKEFDGYITKAKISLLIPADREWLKADAAKKAKQKH